MRCFRTGPLVLILLWAVLTAPPLAAEDRIDINTADAATIARVMKGVGPKKAAAIVAYRKAHGPFRSVYELVKVKGIGKKTVMRNYERIRVGPRSSD